MRLVNCRYGQLQESIHSFRAKTDWRHRLVPKTVHKSNLYKIFVILLWHWLTGMQGILIAISDVHTKTWNLTMNDNNSYDHMWHVGTHMMTRAWHGTGQASVAAALSRRHRMRRRHAAISCLSRYPLSGNWATYAIALHVPLLSVLYINNNTNENISRSLTK